MKIPELTPIQMIRTDEQHFGTGKIVPVTRILSSNNPVGAVQKIDSDTQAASLSRGSAEKKLSFQDYLFEAMDAMNSQQVTVSDMQEKLITNPDEVDVHDVTIAMAKAQMSLSLAQTVIDRLISGWNEISTTR